MKTFEEEYRELAEWYFSEREKMGENASPWGGALDGEATEAIRNLTSEYRKKLNALRGKHQK